MSPAADISETTQRILITLVDLAERVSMMDARLSELARAHGKRRVDPEWLAIGEAARMAGLSKTALDRRLRRLANQIGGSPVRRRHGLVHRADFQDWLRQGERGRGRAAADAIDRLGM